MTENINGNQTPSWRQTYDYDRYGNRRLDESNTDTLASTCTTAVCNPTIDPATNKLIGYTFDNAGNTEVDANGRNLLTMLRINRFSSKIHQTTRSENISMTAMAKESKRSSIKTTNPSKQLSLSTTHQVKW